MYLASLGWSASTSRLMSCCHSAPRKPNSGISTTAAPASAQRLASRTAGLGRHQTSVLTIHPMRVPTAYPMATVMPDMTACRYQPRGSSEGVSDRQ